MEQVAARTRAGHRLVARNPTGARAQLARRVPNQANEDVDGVPLTEAARVERIASLALCTELYGVLKNAEPSEKGRVITRAIELFHSLGFWSDDDRKKREVAFCITCSGLLLLCVDTVLKAIEDWCTFSSIGVIASASRLMTVECRDAAEKAMSGGLKRYEDFVRRFMPDHVRPDTCVFEEDELFQRWEWYLIAECDRKRYYARYAYEAVKDDMINKVQEVQELSTRAAIDMVKNLKLVVEGLDRMLTGIESESASDEEED